MTRRTRRNHTSAFKAKVALAAMKGDKTMAELAQQFDVHANQVAEWKRQLQEQAGDVFGGANEGKTDELPDLKTLHAKIGWNMWGQTRFNRTKAAQNGSQQMSSISFRPD